jgi:hypothetical protein
MFRFRPPSAAPGLSGVPLALETVRSLLDDMTAPRHFFTGPGLGLAWQHLPMEESAWEVFQGRLLDPAHTREKATFEVWNIHQVQDGVRSAEPLLSLKLDAANARIHMVRGLECYVWEGYDAGGNVYLSRERRKWVRELVQTVCLEQFTDLEGLRDELIGALFHAVVGTSRLPLSSVEAPLPAFSFGELFYSYRAGAPEGGPLQAHQALVANMLSAAMNPRERARWLETALHALPRGEPGHGAGLLVSRWCSLGWTAADLLSCLRTLFNEVSLSPYTDLVDRLIEFLGALLAEGFLSPESALDLYASLLIQGGRHLTAYDLITFHHRGANYPDALLLDAVLAAFLDLGSRHPQLLAGDSGRRRRRALRQAWLLRRFYEEHPVPDLPTSPGENNRVLPASYPRVPEEQILQPARRTRRLYDGDPLPDRLPPPLAEALCQAVRDLQHDEELRELGLALYLDRPLGDAKAPAEPDRTVLLSSLAFSPSVARQRLQALKREPLLQGEAAFLDACSRRLDGPAWSAGVSLDRIGPARRPSAVSLADARRAPDFVFLHTTAGTLTDLLGQFDFRPLTDRFALDWLTQRKRALVARSPTSETLLVYDEACRPRLELRVDVSAGYAARANQEYPVNGLQVLRVWEEGGETEALAAQDLRERPIRLPVNDVH